MHVGVVGAGIIGIASSYYLAARGIDVTVFDRASPGTGSTGRANGGIRAQFTSPINVALSQRSMAVWETFEDRHDTDIGFRRPGYLFLAREDATAKRLRENVRTQQGFDVPSRYVSPTEAAEHCPRLAVDRFVGATYSPADGFADPHLALQGFMASARRLGVEVKAHREVIGFEHDDDGVVRAIETDAGRERVDFVVNATGPWARRVAGMVGRDLPVTPRRRSLSVLEPANPVDDSVPLTVDVDRDTHFRPERDGNVVAGGFFADADPACDPDDYDERVSLDWGATLMEHLSDCASYFGPETRFRRGWSGLYAVTPDHHPIIEEAPPGFISAVGFSGHGFMHSPATGQVVADLIERGSSPVVDVDQLDAGRFDRDEALVERTILD